MIPTRYLIINADDFGYNDAITRGIITGFREGLVTSTTAMINIEGAAQRITAALAEEPGLPVGLHLNLTAGRPISPVSAVPHLVRADGTFYPFDELLLRLPDLPVHEVRAELFAQGEALRAAGVEFTHIDYHQQVLALYTPFFRVVEELARHNHVPVRQPSLTRVHGKPGPGKGRNEAGMVLGFLARALGRSPARTFPLLVQILRSAERKQIADNLGTTDWFIGAFFDQPTLEHFVAILRQLPPGTSELMTHPAVDAPELLTMLEGYRDQRPRELAVLLDPQARIEVDRLGIRLISFRDIRQGSPVQSGAAQNMPG